MNTAQRLLQSFTGPGKRTFREGTPPRRRRKFNTRTELRVINGLVRFGDRVRLR